MSLWKRNNVILVSVILIDSVYRTIILKYFFKNIIHSDDSKDSNDPNEKISTKKIKRKLIKCENIKNSSS